MLIIFKPIRVTLKYSISFTVIMKSTSRSGRVSVSYPLCSMRVTAVVDRQFYTKRGLNVATV